nr:hypothetical protein [Pseudarthrobacter oxydans]
MLGVSRATVYRYLI